MVQRDLPELQWSMRMSFLAATSSIARLRATILSYLAEARTDRAWRFWSAWRYSRPAR